MNRPTICRECRFMIEDIGVVRKGEEKFFITKENSPYCIVTHFEITDFVYGRGEEKVINAGTCKSRNNGACKYFIR